MKTLLQTGTENRMQGDEERDLKYENIESELPNLGVYHKKTEKLKRTQGYETSHEGREGTTDPETLTRGSLSEGTSEVQPKYVE